MTNAICFKCGSEKFGAFSTCKECGAVPSSEDELSLSLALCEHLLSKERLASLAREIKNGRRPTIPADLLEQSRCALKDPQLMTLLGRAQQPVQSTEPSPRETQQTPAQAQAMLSSPVNRSPRNLKETALHRNAFWLLGATTRDNRQRVVELAEEKSLEIDHDACQKARSDLTSPRTRLAVEMAWLPGVSPKKAAQLARQVMQDPMSVRSESGLPTLAQANLMAAAFEAVDAEDRAEDVAEFIEEMARVVEELSIDDVLRDINEDRAVSGFPEIKTGDQVESELTERKRYFRNTIKDALDRLPPSSLVDAMTKAVDSVTAGGECHAPELIDELVDSYEVGAQGFLQKEAENVHKLIKAARESAKSGEDAIKPLVDKLEIVARNWDKVAQPIQLSTKARGIKHLPSNELALSIRSLAIDLFNEHDMLTQSKRITSLLQELFSELPELAERVEQDADTLEDIFHNRKQAESRRNEWAREITYRAEVGLIFKDTLSISPDGVAWNDQRYPLDAITRVRWGGVRHSVNGIPTGTTYTLAFGDDRSEAVVELKREEVYTNFVDKLWRAVCVRLLTELLEALKSGEEISFGEAAVRDDGLTLTRHKFMGSEHVRLTWYQVHIWSADGAFYIGAKDDKKTYAGLSYIHIPNAHVLEQAIRMAFKKPGMRGLSDLLRDD